MPLKENDTKITLFMYMKRTSIIVVVFSVFSLATVMAVFNIRVKQIIYIVFISEP